MRWHDRSLTSLTPMGWLLTAVSVVPLVVVLTAFDRLVPWIGKYYQFRAARLSYIAGALAAGLVVFAVGAWLLGRCGRRIVREPSEGGRPAESKNMVEIELDEVEGICFVVGHNTGVTYTHQCGGYSCFQQTHEGFLVPQKNSKELADALFDYFFNGPKYRGFCSQGIDDKDADFIDGLLNSGEQKWIRVDRSKLKDSMEAWIYLSLEPDYPCFPYYYPCSYNIDPASSIVMVWENSD